MGDEQIGPADFTAQDDYPVAFAIRCDRPDLVCLEIEAS